MIQDTSKERTRIETGKNMVLCYLVACHGDEVCGESSEVA